MLSLLCFVNLSLLVLQHVLLYDSRALQVKHRPNVWQCLDAAYFCLISRCTGVTFSVRHKQSGLHSARLQLTLDRFPHMLFSLQRWWEKYQVSNNYRLQKFQVQVSRSAAEWRPQFLTQTIRKKKKWPCRAWNKNMQRLNIVRYQTFSEPILKAE